MPEEKFNFFSKNKVRAFVQAAYVGAAAAQVQHGESPSLEVLPLSLVSSYGLRDGSSCLEKMALAGYNFYRAYTIFSEPAENYTPESGTEQKLCLAMGLVLLAHVVGDTLSRLYPRGVLVMDVGQDAAYDGPG